METFAEEVSAEIEAARQAGNANDGASGKTGDTGQTGDATDGSTGDSNTGAPPDTPASTDAKKDESDPRVRAFQRAAEDEREKRQLEKQLREGLERQVEALRAQVAELRPAEKKDGEEIDYEKIFEDPKAVLNAHTAALSKRQQQQMMSASIEQAKAQLPDYEQTVGKLSNMSVPGLEEAVAKSPAPAFTAYRLIKEHEKRLEAEQQASNSTGRVKELEAKLAELTATIESFQSGSSPSVRSLSQSRGASGGSAQPVKTIDDVLDREWGRKLSVRR
jgi:myosin heavy subunit